MELSNVELTKRYFIAIARSDADEVRKLADPDATVWRNFDGSLVPLSSILQGLLNMSTFIHDLQYANARYLVEGDTVVVQHDLTGRLRTGEHVQIPIIVRVSFNKGKLIHCEEYLDSRAIDSILAVMP